MHRVKSGRMAPSNILQSFTRVIVETPMTLADEAAGIFSAFGSLGCEIRRVPGKRTTKAKTRARIHAYFDKLNSRALGRITKTLQSAGMVDADAQPVISSVEDPGWATMWQKRFEPFPVGDHLLIVPPWNRPTVADRVSITIRPGQAFGTGHHASTFGTLHLMQDLFAERRFERVLDVGTGSGILAIAAHKLGASKIVAIDLDAVALENAIENADLNRAARAIRFSAAPLTSIRGHFDLITANILSSVLIPMAPLLIARLRPDASLILAGILAREADAVIATYKPALKHLRTRADGVWRSLLFQR